MCCRKCQRSSRWQSKTNVARCFFFSTYPRISFSIFRLFCNILWHEETVSLCLCSHLWLHLPNSNRVTLKFAFWSSWRHPTAHSTVPIHRKLMFTCYVALKFVLIHSWFRVSIVSALHAPRWLLECPILWAWWARLVCTRFQIKARSLRLTSVNLHGDFELRRSLDVTWSCLVCDWFIKRPYDYQDPSHRVVMCYGFS